MRVIDADAIRNKAVPHTRGDYGYSADIRKWAVLVCDIDDAPTIDPESLRPKGRWVHPNGYVVSNGFFCSECGHEEASHHAINPRPGGACTADENGNFFHPPKMNYCPNCGAKMEG